MTLTTEDKTTNQVGACQAFPEARHRRPKDRPPRRQLRSARFVLTSVADALTATRLEPAEVDLWSGHSRFLAFWEGGGDRWAWSSVAVITVLTTMGIILVLGVQSIEFSRRAQVSLSDFLFGTELKPDAKPPKFGIVPLIWGTFMVAAGSSVIALADRALERDLSE